MSDLDNSTVIVSPEQAKYAKEIITSAYRLGVVDEGFKETLKMMAASGMLTKETTIKNVVDGFVDKDAENERR